MIQRIQTLFLLAAAILLTCMFFHPFAAFAEDTAGYSIHIITCVLLILSVVTGYLNIFMYRKRMRQIHLCKFNCFVLLILQGVIVYHILTMEADAVLSLTVTFPFIAAILSYVALRYIARDEAKVRTMERLRK